MLTGTFVVRVTHLFYAPRVATHGVLKDPTTEPEAAHLRNVLRRIVGIMASDLVDEAEKQRQIYDAIERALDRPQTNGEVIDQLMTANGDLQSQIERLNDRNRAIKRDAVVTHEKLRNQIDELQEQLEEERSKHAPSS